MKSLPLRVMSRTPAASRRAMMPKPSCLISWIQPGPLGGTFAGFGRQGSMKPTVRLLSRNKTITGYIAAGAQESSGHDLKMSFRVEADEYEPPDGCFGPLRHRSAFSAAMQTDAAIETMW